MGRLVIVISCGWPHGDHGTIQFSMARKGARANTSRSGCSIGGIVRFIPVYDVPIGTIPKMSIFWCPMWAGWSAWLL